MPGLKLNDVGKTCHWRHAGHVYPIDTMTCHGLHAYAPVRTGMCLTILGEFLKWVSVVSYFGRWNIITYAVANFVREIRLCLCIDIHHYHPTHPTPPPHPTPHPTPTPTPHPTHPRRVVIGLGHGLSIIRRWQGNCKSCSGTAIKCVVDATTANNAKPW